VLIVLGLYVKAQPVVPGETCFAQLGAPLQLRRRICHQTKRTKYAAE
jgi:hypothetical protein